MKISQLVRIRRQRWRVDAVREYGACRLITASGAERSTAGLERRFIAPFDDVEAVAPASPVRIVSLRVWQQRLGALVAAASPPGALRHAAEAHIDLLPHQLEPALAVLRGLGTRLLLADDVGLGKTIQAGLVILELLRRGWIERVLVLTPAGLREQWAGELRERFALPATLVDAASLRRLACGLPQDVNPWTTTPIAIASIDFVKRREVLLSVAAARWDAVIVDEAHGAAFDSNRHDAVHAIAAKTPYVLLLTATPHAGDDAAFESLCRIGAAADDPLLVFRRTRAAVRGSAGRRVHTLLVRATAAEMRMHRALARYTDAVRREHGDRTLALSVLHKRAFSSPWALAESIERRLNALGDAAESSQLVLPLGLLDGELTADDDAPPWPADVALADAGRERALLEAVGDAARRADRDSSKLRALRRLARRTGEPIIVFTEYRDTLRRLRQGLARPIVQLHGGLDRVERRLALETFERQPGAVLLATDAAGEGLNLHRRCRIVVSLELPWNPMRLEQRIGRVDRIGQARCVHAFHLVSSAGETAVLQRLRDRLARAAVAIAAPDPLQDVERAIARAVVMNEASPPSPPPASCTIPSGGGRTAPPLESDGREEAERIASIRSTRRGRSPSTVVEPATCVSRMSAGMRRRLGPRPLLVWRCALVDRFGAVAESTLVGAQAGATALATHARGARRLVGDIERAWRTAAAGDGGWAASAASAVASHWRTRLEREQALASVDASGATAEHQPGLFDRRAERAQTAGAGRAAGNVADRADRLARLESMAAVETAPPELVLVVLP